MYCLLHGGRPVGYELLFHVHKYSRSFVIHTASYDILDNIDIMDFKQFCKGWAISD